MMPGTSSLPRPRLRPLRQHQRPLEELLCDLHVLAEETRPPWLGEHTDALLAEYPDLRVSCHLEPIEDPRSYEDMGV